MRAGKLDQKITYRTVPTTKSATGADVPGAPVDFATVYAQITPAKGQRGEFFAADRLNVKTKYDLKHRYVAGLTEGMQVAWGSRTLNVLSVPDVGSRPGYMVVLAEELR